MATLRDGTKRPGPLSNYEKFYKNHGRPKKNRKELIAKLEHAFSMGLTDREACLFANISVDTLYKICKEFKGFSERKELLKENVKMHAKTIIQEAIVQQRKTADAKWYLEHKASDEFSKMNKTDITSKGEQLGVVMLPQREIIEGEVEETEENENTEKELPERNE